MIVGWKYPLIWISSPFPLFLKNRVFVFYIIPSGLMTKGAVSGKEISPSTHKTYSQSIQLTSSLTNLKGRRHFQQVPRVKMPCQYFWWCAICWKYLGASVTWAQKFNYCSYVRPLQLHSLCWKATNPKIRHLCLSFLFFSLLGIVQFLSFYNCTYPFACYLACKWKLQRCVQFLAV